jgi:hypothetical protein
MKIPEFKTKRVFLEDIDLPCLFAKVKNSELPKVATRHIAKHKKDPICEIWVRGSNPKALTEWPKEMLGNLLEKEGLPAALEAGMREYETNKEEWPGYFEDNAETYGEIKQYGILPFLTMHTIVIDEIRRMMILGCHTEWDIHLSEHGIAIFFQDGKWHFRLGDYLSEYLGDVEEEGNEIRWELARPPGAVTDDSVTDASFIEGTWAFDAEEALALLKRIKASSREIKETLDLYAKLKYIIQPPLIIQSTGPLPVQQYQAEWLGCERRGEKVTISYRRKGAAKSDVEEFLYCNGILINLRCMVLKKVASPT